MKNDIEHRFEWEDDYGNAGSAIILPEDRIVRLDLEGLTNLFNDDEPHAVKTAIHGIGPDVLRNLSAWMATAADVLEGKL